MILTEEQKEFLKINAPKINSLIELTQKCFNDESLDGRSKEGRLIRKFLVENEITYETTKKEKKEGVEFTRQEREFIVSQAQSGLSSLRIAEMVFPDKEIKSLSIEQRAVLEVLREINPDIIPSQDVGLLNSYIGPKAPSRIVKKINDATGGDLEEDKLNRQFKVRIERLGVNLNNSRFVRIMNNYLSRDDRELFEQEFIRLTWDKPDLTADEINLYFNVCKEIINLEVVSKHLNKLNELFDEANDQSDMTNRLSEIIKSKSTEYHQCETRIENLTKKLQGDRAERMKSRSKDNASILSIVQLFQEQDERKNMVRIAEMQKTLIKEEAHRLEGMAEWRARVLGVNMDDVI
jgi:hypothetical protein